MQGAGTLGLGLGLGLRKSRCHVASLEPVLRCSGALTLDLTLTLILTLAGPLRVASTWVYL